MSIPVEKKKKTSLVFNSSSCSKKNSIPGIHHVSRSSRSSFTDSQSHITSIWSGDSNRNSLERRTSQCPRRALQVFDSEGKDVTPLPLHDTEPGVMHSKPARLFLDEVFSSSGSGYSKSTSIFNVPSSSSSRLFSKASLTKETEDSDPKLDIPKTPPSPFEEMLDEVVDICLSETDTISLLDIPSTIVSEDADDAEAVKERNIHYAELCKKRKMDNDNKYMVRSMQTFDGALKDKQTQSDKIVMVDKGTIATIWDIYDSFSVQNETPESEKADYLESTVNTSNGQETSTKKSSSMSSTVGTGSAMVSPLKMEMCRDSFNTEADPQLIMLSESFQHSLLVMERSIVANIFQPKLAAYRQLPVLEDPESTVKPATEEQSEEGDEGSSAPTLERLWAFSCELTKGRNITSMAWNKKSLDILAVGYGDCSIQTPGLICCWSLKNPTWPDRVIHTHSCITSLDFSANNPGHLAVGMWDGTIAIYSMQSQNGTCISNSSECSKKHQGPVWQVIWTKQEMSLPGEERLERLTSVSEDGRIARWFPCGKGLECIVLMELKKDRGKEVEGIRIGKCFLPAVNPALCIVSHPTNPSIYLTGTWKGLIHKCAYSNNHHFLETYEKHFCHVNHIEWSPFCSDVFLSCSSDWTIQLWKEDHLTPVLSFTSTQKAVYAVRWSPNWSAIFAAVKGGQVEIWDLNSSILCPTIVHHASPGVKFTSLLFARGTDCVFLGDTDGQVTVYQLKNLNVGEGQQVDSLEDIIHSALSRRL